MSQLSAPMAHSSTSWKVQTSYSFLRITVIFITVASFFIVAQLVARVTGALDCHARIGAFLRARIFHSAPNHAKTRIETVNVNQIRRMFLPVVLSSLLARFPIGQQLETGAAFALVRTTTRRHANVGTQLARKSGAQVFLLFNYISSKH